MTPDAFAEYYERTFREVYRYISHAVLGDRALAEDLTQDTYASVVGAFRDGRAEVNSIPWVIGVARHKVIDHYRRSERERRRLVSVWAGEAMGGADDDADLDVDDPDRLLAIMRGVSPIHRLVLVLRFVDDLAVNDIARLLGRSVHATESLLVRARRELVRSYRGDES
jgi:RNA polymerase sigma-70 factor (ECF subfamily)